MISAHRPHAALAVLAAVALPTAGALAVAVAVEAVPLAAAGVAALCLPWLAWLAARGGFRPVRLSLALGGLVMSAAALASVFVARQPSPFSISVAAAPAGAALVASMARDARVRRCALSGMAGVTALLGAWSVASWASGDATEHQVRGAGGRLYERIYPEAFGHPNQYAAAMVLLLPFPLAGAVAAPGALRRALFAIALALGVAALFLTYSRAFWLGFAASALVVASGRWARVALIGGGVALAALAGRRIVERFTSEDTLDNVRTEIWARSLGVIAERPLLGVGIENFPLHADGVNLPDTAVPPPHAHNLLLATATEIGLVATGGLVVVLAVLSLALLRRLRSGAGSDRALALACGGAIVGGLVGGLFDAVVFHNVHTLALAAATMGLAAAVTAPALGRRAGAVERAPA